MPNIIVGVTGSIAAPKASTIARGLNHAGCNVRIAMTRSAMQFIQPISFGGVSDAPAYTDMWLDQMQEGDELHTAWGRWADIIVICPATASVMADLCQGSFNSTVTLLAANVRPTCWILVPAMSACMWAQPAVRRNAKRLQRWGVTFLGPDEGRVADGTIGARMRDPKKVVSEVAARAAELPFKEKI